MKKLHFLFIVLFSIALFSCSSSDDNDGETPSSEIKILDERKEISIKNGDDIEIQVNKSFSKDEIEVYIGNHKLDYNVYSKNSNTHYITFRVDANLGDVANQSIVLKKGNVVIVTGPKITAVFAYRMQNITGTYFAVLRNGICGLDDNSVLNFSSWAVEDIHFVKTTVSGTDKNKRENFTFKYPEHPLASDGFTWGGGGVSHLPKIWGMARGANKTYIVENSYSRKVEGARYFILEKEDGIDESTNFYWGGFDKLISNIEVDSKGHLYIIEDGKGAITKLMPKVEPYIVAGSATALGYKDGKGAEALFEQIVGLGLDKDENIYVAEKTRVRKITTDGVVTTLIGENISGTLSNVKLENVSAFEVGPDGQLYILDKSNTVLTIVSKDGAATTQTVIGGHMGNGDTLEGSSMIVKPDGRIVLTSYSQATHSIGLYEITKEF